MSKLIDRINDLARPSAAAMGFRRTEADEKKLSMLVVAEVTGRGDAEIKEIAGLGVGVVVINCAGRSAAALARELKSCRELVIGLVIDSAKSVNGLKNSETEIDFIICDSDTPLKLYAGSDLEKSGRVIRLDIELEPARLRAVNGLYPATEAVLVDIEEEALTVGDLLSYRRVAEHVGLPVIAALKGCLAGPELVALRGAGIKVLLLPSDWPVGDIRDCLDTIAALPKAVRPKDREKGSVSLLPHLSTPAVKKEEGGEDDDDDD